MQTEEAIRTLVVGNIGVRVYSDRQALGRDAGRRVAEAMRSVLRTKDLKMVFAAAASQVEFLAQLGREPGINWDRITAFHLDEYIGVSTTAPRSFARFLRENLFDKVGPREFHALDGMARDGETECRRYEALLKAAPLDIACAGIGENGHLAFNDPPFADFGDSRWVKVVEPDLVSRQQQVADGCFREIKEMPTKAFTLTLPAIVSARSIFCMVPGERKAQAVKKTLEDPVSTACPATILRKQGSVTLFLDSDSSRLIDTSIAKR